MSGLLSLTAVSRSKSSRTMRRPMMWAGASAAASVLSNVSRSDRPADRYCRWPV
jgi:hypothetical protein